VTTARPASYGADSPDTPQDSTTDRAFGAVTVSEAEQPTDHSPVASPTTPADTTPSDAAGPSTPQATSTAGDGARTPRPLRLPLAIIAALVSGLLLLLSLPPYDAWWAAPGGVALLAAAVHRRRARAGFWLGGLAGLALFVPLLRWTAIHPAIGWWPWLLLAATQACYIAVLGAIAAYCTPLVERRRWVWPLLTGACWVLSEALRSRVPFGGFPWGRLAFGQADSPLLGLAAVGGAPLVTFAVAVIGGLITAALWPADTTQDAADRRTARVRIPAFLVVAVLVVLSGFALPPLAGGGSANGERMQVAIIQGNVPRLGLDFNAQRRAVLDNHVNATLELARRVNAGQEERPDLVIWPENSSDIDPLLNADAASRINDAAQAINAPILVGAMLQGPGEHTRNTALLWMPDQGPVDSYVKQHPVPFAEYLPMRGLVERITDAARLAGNQVSGDEPGIMTVGSVTIGDVICFEVAYDGLVRQTVTNGAQLLVVQTNNATFNSDEAEQQMAMVRLRAVEHGRPAVMASTVGVSGFADPDGDVHEITQFNTQAILTRTLTLGQERTLATRLGVIPEIVIVGSALTAIAIVMIPRRRPR